MVVLVFSSKLFLFILTKKLSDPMQLDGLQDGAFLRGLLGHIPEHTVVHRNRGNSFQVVPERRATFPEEFEVEASFTFSKDTRYSYDLDR